MARRRRAFSGSDPPKLTVLRLILHVMLQKILFAAGLAESLMKFKCLTRYPCCRANIYYGRKHFGMKKIPTSPTDLISMNSLIYAPYGLIKCWILP